jgi:uncharacterized membrane protein YGL010W
MNSLTSLEAQMAIYAAYHQDARNKATHFIGVPAIALALLIPLAWLRAGELSAAMVLAAALALYYLVLDLALGVAMFVVLALLVWAAHSVAMLGAAIGWTCFGVLFVGGWILQLVGHVFEGRRPALVDNLFQIFIAPIFLCAEIFFTLGYRAKLRSAVELRAKRMRAQA